MNYFEYNGIRSSDMGLRIEKKEVFGAPKYDTDFIEIPGRDGDLIMSNGRYSNMQVTYSVFLPTKSIGELADKITAIKAWLYAEPASYHELRDSYDTKYFRKAVFSSKLDIEDELNKIGIFTVSFSCFPFRYLETGFNELSLKSGNAIFNPTAFTSKPYLRVIGNGTGTLTLQTINSNQTWRFESISGYVEIDSEQMNFYKGTVSCNDKVEGSGFPILESGTNTFSYTGGITGINVIPRWMSL